MSKKNIDLTEFWTAVDLHDKNYAPKHLPMKFHERSHNDKVEYMYPDKAYSKQSRLYRYVPRFLEKNIGKLFDDVFSKFCKEQPEYIGDLNTRQVFKEQFIEYTPIDKYWHKPSFCKDSQGRIQSNKTKRIRCGNKRSIYESTPEYYYVFNDMLLKKYPTFDACLYRIIGKKLYDFCHTEERFNDVFVNKIISVLIDVANVRKLYQAAKEDGYNGYHTREDFVDNLFIKKTDTPVHVVSKKSGEYIKILKEQDNAKKYEEREREKERKERYDAALRLIWEIKEKERQQDIIDRDRLGFDEMSFKKRKEE